MILTSVIEQKTQRPAGTAIALLDGWIKEKVPVDAYLWFRQQCQGIAEEPQDHQLVKAMGMAARKLGKADLHLDANGLEQATLLRAGFDPSLWSVDLAARVAFILAGYHGDDAAFARRLDMLADQAEINELIALYSGFALYPASREIEHRGREAIRSSMRPVFEALAHRNPYPCDEFDEPAWNQMVVKTFFLDSPLWPVQGLEQRNNPALAGILIDLAHERWAAGRVVSPELWRCVTPYAGGQGVLALLHTLTAGTENEKLAIAKSLPPVGSLACLPVRARCEELGLIAPANALSWQALYERNTIST